MIPQGSDFLTNLAQLINLGMNIYMWMIIIRVLISWVNPDPRNSFVQLLARATDPPLNFIRRLVPLTFGGIDFSPILLILLLVFLNDVVVFFLSGLSRGMSVAGIIPIFLISLIRLIQGVFQFLLIVLIIRAVLSWISPDPYNFLVRMIYGVTEPFLAPLRRTLPLVFGGVDLTPLALCALIYLGIFPLLSYLTMLILDTFNLPFA